MFLKDSLYKSILHLLTINGGSYLIMFLNSVIIFRTVDKSYYGLYVVMISLFAITELLMAGLNDSIVRFLKDKVPLKDKQSIVLFVLIYKYLLITIFIICAYLASKYGLFEYLIGNYEEVSSVINSFLILVVLNGVLSNFISVNNSILNSQLEYKFTAKIDFGRNIIFLLIVLILSLKTTNYLYYLYSSSIISVFALLILSHKIRNNHISFSLLNVIKAKTSITIGKKYIIPYSAPLTGSSLLTFVKNNLPTIILGKEFSLEGVAIFSILKTFFKALHSVSGSFVNPMMSQFLDLKNTVLDFSSKLSIIFFGMLFLRLGIFILMLLVIDYFFLIYKLENNSVNQFIFYVLGLEYVIAGMIMIYGINLRLENNTKKVLMASLARFIVELTLIYYILIDYGIMAAALILLIARFVETSITYIYCLRGGLFHYHVFFIIILIPIIYYFSFEMIQ
jgi:O-antigen/teichoic acid export membrane protein